MPRRRARRHLAPFAQALFTLALAAQCALAQTAGAQSGLPNAPSKPSGQSRPKPAAPPRRRAAQRPPNPPTRSSNDGWSARTTLLDNDILVGAKAGAQFTDYSNSNLSGVGYAAGGALVWNVGLPKLEANVFVHDREQGSRIPFVYVGFPVLARFCLTQNRRIAWNAGAGVQIDLAVSGASTRRNVAVGLPFSTDFLIRLDQGPYIDLEFRYVYGLESYEGPELPPRPRDIDIMIGLLFPIDRTGF